MLFLRRRIILRQMRESRILFFCLNITLSGDVISYADRYNDIWKNPEVKKRGVPAFSGRPDEGQSQKILLSCAGQEQESEDAKKMKKAIKQILVMMFASLLMISGVCMLNPATADAAEEEAYPLWIGGVQANENNCNKLSDNHWSYDPATHTLTLSGYTYQGHGYVYNSEEKAGAAIYYNGADNLSVTLTGENHITLVSETSGIVNDNASSTLTFSGAGKLLIDGIGNFNYYDSAVYSRGTVNFQSGSFSLGGTDADYGVKVDSDCFVVIDDGIKSFEAEGYYAAINGKVRNAVAGTGYDAYKTTAKRVKTSSTGAALTYTSGLETKAFQAATFPVGQYTVVFNPGDGKGNMDPTKIAEGEFLTLPACTFTPPKDANKNNKIFSRWEVSGVDGIFNANSEVLIANNCASSDNVVTVTAKWTAKTQAAILVDAEGQELDYTGDSQKLLSKTGLPFGGTMVYAFGKDDTTVPKDGWNAALPSKTDAGTYYIWYKVACDGEHLDSEARCTTAKINQASAQTLPDVEAKAAPSVSASVAGKMPADAGKLTFTAGTATATGSVTVSDFVVDTKGRVSAALSGGAAGDTVTLPVTIGSTNYADSTVNVVITLTETIKKADPKTPVAPAKAGRMIPKPMKAKGKRSLILGWSKVAGAEGYDIFFAKCSKDKCRKIKTIKGNKTFSWTKSGLKTKTAYKAYVKAWVTKGGKKMYIATSPVVHSYTANGTKNFTNAKSITVKKAKVSLKAGKTYKIKAKIKKFSKKKKLMPEDHAKYLRFMSSNPKIATVSSSGKIKAKSVGTCAIYVYAHNGVSKKVKVTVR